MSALFDAFWRASAYCLHPRVVLWSLLPLLLASAATLALGYAYWEAAVDGVRATLDGWALTAALSRWLESIGAGGLRALLAPLIVVALAVPVIVVASLLLVAALMTPALVSLVARRRFPTLERRDGVSWVLRFVRALALGVLALALLAASMPLWFVPPLALLLPPLIWGWLAYRVLAFDVLAAHASSDERRALLAAHRGPLLGMGLVSGFLGALPSMLWAMGALALIFAPLLAVLSIWLYTLVFAFSALWFAHYALAALQTWRVAHAPPAEAAAMPAAGPGTVRPAGEPPLLPRPQA